MGDNNGFEYINTEYPPQPATTSACPDAYAYDELRDRCVSMVGWCEGKIWMCDTRENHPQFVCKPARDRPQRCCRAWWPPEDGITPVDAQGEGRCWKWKPRLLESAGVANSF